MRLHTVLADPELVADLAVAVALPNVGDDRPLALGQLWCSCLNRHRSSTKVYTRKSTAGVRGCQSYVGAHLGTFTERPRPRRFSFVERPVTPTIAADPWSVLVVENDDAVRTTVVEGLRDSGLLVEAITGADRIDDWHGDVIVTDTFAMPRSEEHTSELQSQSNLVCRLLLEKKNQIHTLA